MWPLPFEAANDRGLFIGSYSGVSMLVCLGLDLELEFDARDEIALG